MLRTIFKVIALFLMGSLLLTRDTLPPGDKLDRVRAYTRSIEFDYASWMLDALALKIQAWSLGAGRYLPEERYPEIVKEYLVLMGQVRTVEAQINDIYTDPMQTDPFAASAELRAELDRLTRLREDLSPLAESILQGQVAQVLSDIDLTMGGQPIPPVLYHSTPLPLALIVSPREVIRQDADISLLPDLTIDEQAALESRVDQGLNVSSLVVPIGGVGVYPTMVQQTTDLNWLAEVVAHEWIHNYLTLRPLGMSYLNSPELRIMNETSAAIAGKEIGREVIARFYPELAPPPPAPPAEPGETAPAPVDPPPFSFVKEMHETRVTADKLLAEGKIAEAEAYFEERRRFLYENGYHIRKLNQAYFAFYGAYADQPGGAAGEDPVGAAVRALRARSQTLAEFINRIAWMASYEDLQEAVAPEEAQLRLTE